MLKQAYPLADISGVDGDGDMVRRARKKAAGREVDVNFYEGLAQSLPFPEKTYDLVVSSLFFHHLDRTGKRLALYELRRVLEPGGAILVADWAKPSNGLMRLLFYPVQWADGFTSTRDHVAGAFPAYFREAGFESLRETAKFDTPLGTVRIYRAMIGAGFQVD
jgi:ubiquinone/menaquinone biosynthesis C-methylase UbiE